MSLRWDGKTLLAGNHAWGFEIGELVVGNRSGHGALSFVV